MRGKFHVADQILSSMDCDKTIETDDNWFDLWSIKGIGFEHAINQVKKKGVA